MAQILIIESDETLRKIIKLNLIKNAGCDVVEMKSSREAIELLRILPDLDLIICREIIKNDPAGLNISTYLTNEKLQTPLLIMKNDDWKQIVTEALKVLGIGEGGVKKILPVYVPVSIDYFMNINTLYSGCDVYIRVKKSEKDFQYVKRLHGGDHFNREDILRYHADGLSEFYISKDEFTKFVNFVTKDLIKKLGDNKISGTKRITLSSDAYKITKERIHSIGIDDLTILLVEESITSMTNLLKEQNNLAMFLKSLKANECSYAYAHSYLCCLILHKIITQFDWQSPQIREKLTYIAYFHDISLYGSDLTEINTQEDFDLARLTDEDRKIVNNHALDSAKIVEKFEKIPQGIGAIIKEHHGSKTGVGFVENYSAALMPLSMMFIVTEIFVDELLKVKGNPTGADMKIILSKLQPKFNKLTYGQTLVALQNMMTGKKS